MRILNVIDHILDKDSGNVVLSQKEIAKDNLGITKYVEKAIDKFEKSEYVELELSRISMLEQFWNSRGDFQQLTEKFALDYFDSIKVNEKIPGGDLLFFNVELDDLSQVIGIAKLDYTQRYIHNVEYDEDVLVNNIVQNNSILPSPGQGVKNMILIDADKVQLREQSYTGASGKWLMSKNFLQVAAVPVKVSNDVKQIKKSIQKISEKYDDEDDFAVTSKTQQAIHDSLETDGVIDNDYIANMVFDKKEEAKAEFKDELAKKAIESVVAVPNANYFEKKYERQKIKLDNGIEINVPISLLKNRDAIEFETNPDGSTSVVIKNVGSLKSNF
ncbi:nucleoid-associated protein [Lactiplantibacillus pingfangensis]|uniref:nucleoid-associated protein n=1 Tax=Lactiplantibacillus pingfangensis TaxID=2559915 RepID=UPI0010F61DD2|nr:nucleoid-associated protein [Lactiplantibacillus pingfangensis]